MNVLTVSDILAPLLYSPRIKERFSGTDLAIDCGDLPYYYLEYIGDELNSEQFFVRGNHSKEEESTTAGLRRAPMGATDLHRRVVNYQGLLMAGVEGSLRYRIGPFQYSQADMWWHVFALVPGLLTNRLRYGRCLDVFVTHASPWGIHDQPDLPHHGIKAFRWFDKVFKPAYHFHGHIHVYRPDTVLETKFESTWVVNTFGYRLTRIQPGEKDLARVDSPIHNT
jgi:uncharacterized protein